MEARCERFMLDAKRPADGKTAKDVAKLRCGHGGAGGRRAGGKGAVRAWGAERRRSKRLEFSICLMRPCLQRAAAFRGFCRPLRRAWQPDTTRRRRAARKPHRPRRPPCQRKHARNRPNETARNLSPSPPPARSSTKTKTTASPRGSRSTCSRCRPAPDGPFISLVGLFSAFVAFSLA